MELLFHCDHSRICNAACAALFSSSRWLKVSVPFILLERTGNGRHRQAEKRSSGSAAEWCTTAPLGFLTGVTLFDFNLDLDFQPLPADSWEWRRMIRSLWVHPHLVLSKFSKACVTHGHADLWLYVWAASPSGTPASFSCRLHCGVTSDQCTQIHSVWFAHLYQWLYFYIYGIKS